MNVSYHVWLFRSVKPMILQYFYINLYDEKHGQDSGARISGVARTILQRMMIVLQEQFGPRVPTTRLAASKNIYGRELSRLIVPVC